jgi:hypothetical protein
MPSELTAAVLNLPRREGDGGEKGSSASANLNLFKHKVQTTQSNKKKWNKINCSSDNLLWLLNFRRARLWLSGSLDCLDDIGYERNVLLIAVSISVIRKGVRVVKVWISVGVGKKRSGHRVGGHSSRIESGIRIIIVNEPPEIIVGCRNLDECFGTQAKQEQRYLL